MLNKSISKFWPKKLSDFNSLLMSLIFRGVWQKSAVWLIKNSYFEKRKWYADNHAWKSFPTH